MAGSTKEYKMKNMRHSNFSGTVVRLIAGIMLASCVFAIVPSAANAARLDEMSLERWKKVREAERYQLKIAEKYFREKNWKVAMSEYEKYLTLYERSEAAPYAQLKWSICLVNLRKPNTAIKEGFQSVIDYWPESDDATAASYYIGNAYKNMGEIRAAKKAYQKVLTKHPKHLVSVYSVVDLIDITRIEDDIDTRLRYWKKLAFDTARNRESNGACVTASQQLASHYMYQVAFPEAVKALETTYNESQLPGQVFSYSTSPISSLTGDSKTKAKGDKLADLVISFLKQKAPKERTTPQQKAAARQFEYYVADIHNAARRDAKVIEVYNQILKSFGSDDGTLGRMAGWYKSRNRYDDARKNYALYENKIEGMNQIAYSHRQQGKYEPAVLTYRQILGVDSEHLIRWNSEIAATYREVRKYKECIAVYEELLKADAEHAESWRWNIATAYRDSGKYKEAIAYFRQCTNFPSNYTEMAGCHRALKEWNEAIILYNQVMGGAAGSAPWALLQIGYTREQAGQKEKAIMAFQQVCKRFPKNGYASQAHAYLQSKYKITVTLGGAKVEK